MCFSERLLEVYLLSVTLCLITVNRFVQSTALVITKDNFWDPYDYGERGTLRI